MAHLYCPGQLRVCQESGYDARVTDWDSGSGMGALGPRSSTIEGLTLSRALLGLRSVAFREAEITEVVGAEILAKGFKSLTN